MPETLLEISDPAATSPPAWNRLIRQFNGPFVGSYEWSQCMVANTGKQCRFLVLKKQGEPAAAGWYTITGRHVGPVSINRQLEMESLPCYDPRAITAEEIVREILALARREKIVRITYGNSPEEYLPAIEAYGPVSEKISFALDLDLPEAVLFSNLKDSVRRKLRKADSAGLRVVPLSSADEPLLAALPPLFEHTISKHIGLGKKRHSSETRFFLDAVAQLVATGAGTVFVALRNEKAASCALISTGNGDATYLFGASAPEGYRLNAAYRIMWSAVEYLKRRGCRTFSLGEVHARARNENDPDHGLYRFKKEFGGASKRLISGRVITRPLQYGVLTAIRRLRNPVRYQDSTA